MKIVIVDDLNLENNQIEELGELAQVIVHNDKPSFKELFKRVKQADIVVTNTTKITKEVITATPHLRMIAAAATGAEAIVDTEAAKKKNIVITNVPHYASESVAELTFGLIVNLIRKISAADKSVRSGDNSFQPFLGWELKGKTLGIIGFGAIGKRVAEIALALKMKVLANDIKPKKKLGVTITSLKMLLKKSDVITIHCDLNSTSENLLGEREFSLIKKTAIIINTAREEIINETSLITAIKNKQIAGLGLELNILRKGLRNHALLGFDNVVLTPHIGFFTKEALIRRKEIVFNNIISFLLDKPKNIFKTGKKSI